MSTATSPKRRKERKGSVVSRGTLDALFVAASLIFMAGFFYFVVVGVRHRERAISRSAALAFLASLVMAVVFLVRLLP